uniref:P2X purinoreceptor 7 intracellular domain-containing protein n=1 Tax=Arion vulgaris TaxID=1028688 RepID=A0A0B6ZXH9_9EUPU
MSQKWRDPKEWCTCTRCTLELNLDEEKCCRSLPNFTPADGSCITLSSKFKEEVLNRNVLLTHMGTFFVVETRSDAFYHCACRWFTRWMYGVLGQDNRITIPACVLRAFRENL